MNKTPKILVVGSLNMDLIVSTNRFPTKGETVLGCDFGTVPGGKGANQAVQAAKLGAHVDMVGCVGNDVYGQTLLQSAKAAGVGTDYVQIDETASTAVANILIETRSDGKSQNRIIVVPGANMAMTPESVSFLKESIHTYDMVVLQMEIPMCVNEAVINIAFGTGVPVLLNPAPANVIKDETLNKLDYLAPNESEAAVLTGLDIRNEDGKFNQKVAEKAAQVLLFHGVKNVIITLGDAGAICVNNDGAEYCPCVEGIAAIDPTAAGDSFIGAFAVAKTSGYVKYGSPALCLLRSCRHCIKKRCTTVTSDSGRNELELNAIS